MNKKIPSLFYYSKEKKKAPLYRFFSTPSVRKLHFNRQPVHKPNKKLIIPHFPISRPTFYVSCFSNKCLCVRCVQTAEICVR